MLTQSHRHLATTLPFLLMAFLGAATESRADSTHGYTINSITHADAGSTSILIDTHREITALSTTL